MNLKASVPRGKNIDLRTRCGKLRMTPHSVNEEEFLSAIYRAVVNGGRITVEVKGEEKARRLEFDAVTHEGRSFRHTAHQEIANS